jgi:hypothetical protein
MGTISTVVAAATVNIIQTTNLTLPGPAPRSSDARRSSAALSVIMKTTKTNMVTGPAAAKASVV